MTTVIIPLYQYLKKVTLVPERSRTKIYFSLRTIYTAPIILKLEFVTEIFENAVSVFNISYKLYYHVRA